MVEFIKAHVGERPEGLRWGVETICAQLTELGANIAPATYYEHRAGTVSKRAVRDAQLATEIARVHAANYGVYGARKVWLASTGNGPPTRSRSPGAPWSG